MRVGVIVPREQPLRVDREFVYECGNNIDEEQRVDQVLATVDEPPELCGRNEQSGGKSVERVERLPRNDVADSLDNGFDERLVDRLRQKGARRKGKVGKKTANSTAN
jgi:hypothetical protein